MASVLTVPHFHDEAAAYEFVEAHVWPNGPFCLHCGEAERIYRIAPNPAKKVRLGLHKCGSCRKQFTVKVGTVFESSHVPLHVWLQAMHLICSSKKGISSNQLHRTLGVTLKTAWFMSHRIREAMRDGSMSPLGGKGKFVEVDETYIGRVRGMRKTRGPGHKMKVLSLVERGGSIRSIKVESVSRPTVEAIVKANVNRESRLMTDEAPYYPRIGRHFAGHESVNHSADEWAHGAAHTNTLEGFFSIFKRGMRGVYQHCGERHLHRYLAEFDFRYNNRSGNGTNDQDRTCLALSGIIGKRLTYRLPDAA
jgi:transposase-like protein